MTLIRGNPSIQRLIEEKIIPSSCFRFEVISDASEQIIKLVSHCYVTEEQFRIIADTLIHDREKANTIAETIIYSFGRDGKDGLSL